MNSNRYVENIQKKLSKYFDIETTYSYKNIAFDVFAKSFVRNEKYMASKKVVVYAFENNEYTFIKSETSMNIHSLNRFKETLIMATQDFVKPHGEHMSSIVTGVILLENGLDEELVKEIKKFKFTKSFAFGFKGWVYVRLLVVDLRKGLIIANKRGGEVKKFYEI
ncbi:hypothetical protein Amet_1379 [Alkaliphilus metalliredigens QYMF]|uniref:DUF8052 domain-containing protein n=1 Tax=Alkaliphilus metalliredigens (strain QYMF) TaxID=293826 RepID=A6TN11_ALKMQ|nr:hypothetical protein [Alkaliphilus metalliredigens]ABR47579.1 hypothetical protein Amet_1379 [Alkaliphilus metalliredigens QYMF]